MGYPRPHPSDRGGPGTVRRPRATALPGQATHPLHPPSPTHPSPGTAIRRSRSATHPSRPDTRHPSRPAIRRLNRADTRRSNRRSRSSRASQTCTARRSSSTTSWPQFFSTEANYTIWSPQGQPAAYVREEGVSGAKKAFRVLNQASQTKAERKLTIYRPDGMPYFHFYKPYGFMGTPQMQVLTPQGGLIGHLRKRAARLGDPDRAGAADRLLRTAERPGHRLAATGTGPHAARLRRLRRIPLADVHRRRPLRPPDARPATGANAHPDPRVPPAFDTAVSQNRSIGGWL